MFFGLLLIVVVLLLLAKKITNNTTFLFTHLDVNNSPFFYKCKNVNSRFVLISVCCCFYLCRFGLLLFYIGDCNWYLDINSISSNWYSLVINRFFFVKKEFIILFLLDKSLNLKWFYYLTPLWFVRLEN